MAGGGAEKRLRSKPRWMRRKWRRVEFGETLRPPTSVGRRRERDLGVGGFAGLKARLVGGGGLGIACRIGRGGPEKGQRSMPTYGAERLGGSASPLSVPSGCLLRPATGG